jgi:hypothetical protein
MIINGKELTCKITDSGCFEVISHKPGSNGYITIRYWRLGENGRPHPDRGSAHRFIYEKNHGPIPDGLVIRHTCDNKKCINPAHLIIGTQKENLQDCFDRGRHSSQKKRMERLKQDQGDNKAIMKKTRIRYENTNRHNKQTH